MCLSSVFIFVCVFLSLSVLRMGCGDLIVLIPDYCLSLYFDNMNSTNVKDVSVVFSQLNLSDWS